MKLFAVVKEPSDRTLSYLTDVLHRTLTLGSASA